MLPFYDPNWFSSPPLVGIPGDGQSTPVGMIHRWIDAVGVSRPVVAIRRSTHGTYMAQDCGVPGIYWQPDGMIVGRQPTDPYTACIHTDANAMIYVPETYPCSPAAGCGAVAVPQSRIAVRTSTTSSARSMMRRSGKAGKCTVACLPDRHWTTWAETSGGIPSSRAPLEASTQIHRGRGMAGLANVRRSFA